MGILKVSDYIIYTDKDGSQYPGKILAIHAVYPRVKVFINHYRGDRTVWVKPVNLKLQ